jgi:adenine-specific DNA-methyltransferase
MTPAATKRINDALKLLLSIGIPREQQNERSALTLLALANIKPRKPWKSATDPLRRITEIIDWMRDHYDTRYAPNTRETIRRQTVHQFVQHGLLIENPDNPERPINSPKWCYQLTPAALKLITSFGTAAFTKELKIFLKNPATHSLQARHRNLPREIVRLPDGMTIELSAGGQNTLIRSIIEEFTPRFVRNRELHFFESSTESIITDPVIS